MRRAMLVVFIVVTAVACSGSSKARSPAVTTSTLPPRMGRAVTIASGLCALPTSDQLTTLLGSSERGIPQVPGTRDYSAPNCGFIGGHAHLEIEVYKGLDDAGMRSLRTVLTRARLSRSCNGQPSGERGERVDLCAVPAARARDHSGEATLVASVAKGRSEVTVALRAYRGLPFPAAAHSKLVLLRSLAESAMHAYGAS